MRQGGNTLSDRVVVAGGGGGKGAHRGGTGGAGGGSHGARGRRGYCDRAILGTNCGGGGSGGGGLKGKESRLALRAAREGRS